MSRGPGKRKQLIELPDVELNIPNILKKAEHDGKYCIESELRGIGYVYNEGVLNVLSSTHGFIFIREIDVEAFAIELLDIIDDINTIKKSRSLKRRKAV